VGERTVEGRVTPGLGVGGRYVSHPYYRGEFRRLLGCDPYPGTLNFRANVDWRELAGECEPLVIKETVWSDGRRLGAVYAWPARVELADGAIEALVIRPLLSRHEPNVLEVVACERIGDRLPDSRVRARIRCSPGGSSDG